MPLNIVWGLWFIVVLGTWSSVNLVAASILVPLLALPLAGLARMAGLATRREAVHVTDALDPLRRRLWPVVVSAIGFTVAAVILGVNVVTGLAVSGLVGAALATASAWGLVVLAGAAVTWWPLLTDPAHDAVPARNIARLCALLLLAHPLRMGLLVARGRGRHAGEHDPVRRGADGQRGVRDAALRALRAPGGGPAGGADGPDGAGGRRGRVSDGPGIRLRRLFLGDFVAPPPLPMAGQRIVVTAWVARTRDAVVLIDTGSPRSCPTTTRPCTGSTAGRSRTRSSRPASRRATSTSS